MKIPDDEIIYISCIDCKFCFEYNDNKHYPTHFYCRYYERDIKMYDAGLCPIYYVANKNIEK